MAHVKLPAASGSELTIEHDARYGTTVKLGGVVIARGRIPQRHLDELIAQYRRPLGQASAARSDPPNAEPEPPAERERTFGVEPLLGWRVWTVRRYETLDGRVELRLAPISDFLLWHPHQRVTALCTKNSGRFTATGPEHEAPHPDCGCGLWAVDRTTAEQMYQVRQRAVDPSVTVFGQVAMWGRVLEFEKGYRAQYAYPTVLYGYTEHEEIVRGLGDVYGVPVRILPGRIQAEAGELAREFAVQLAVSTKQAAKAMQDLSKAFQNTAQQMVVSPAPYRKLHGLKALADVERRLRMMPAEKPGDAIDHVEMLVRFAIAGSTVVDIYVHHHAAQDAIRELNLYLRESGDKFKPTQRGAKFPSGGSYEALSASNEQQAIQYFRGRRVDIVDMPPHLSDQFRGFVTAHGATIL